MRQFQLNFWNTLSNTKEEEYEKIHYYAYIFILYSFFGWILEMIYHIAQGIIENRGFLWGPFCIIYGFGACLMLFIYPRLKIKNKIVKGILFWIYVFVICSILEYLTSWLLEVIFQIKLWDYSNFAYHINGRISLVASTTWAFCGILVIYVIQPFVKKLFEKLKTKKFFYVWIRIILLGMAIDWFLAILRYS